MKILALLTTILALSTGRADAGPAQAAAPEVFFLVTRAASGESRALLSARLIKLNGSNLKWYDEANVLRLELPAEALECVRADPDVVLALPDLDPSTEPSKAPAAPPGMIQNLPPAPMPMATVPPPPPSGGMMMGSGSGNMMMSGMGLIDSLAGGLVSRLFNRPPTCKVSIGKTAALFTPAGGEEVIEVKASGSCSWQAQASVPWIKISSGTGVSGSGIISYTVTASAGKGRTGSISLVAAPGGNPIRGQATVVVSQPLAVGQ
jgi:hypothetical protein